MVFRGCHDSDRNPGGSQPQEGSCPSSGGRDTKSRVGRRRACEGGRESPCSPSPAPGRLTQISACLQVAFWVSAPLLCEQHLSPDLEPTLIRDDPISGSLTICRDPFPNGGHLQRFKGIYSFLGGATIETPKAEPCCRTLGGVSTFVTRAGGIFLAKSGAAAEDGVRSPRWGPCLGGPVFPLRCLGRRAHSVRVFHRRWFPFGLCPFGVEFARLCPGPRTWQLPFLCLLQRRSFCWRVPGRGPSVPGPEPGKGPREPPWYDRR